MAWVHRGTRATNGRSVWNQYMWMCIVWRSFGHCGDIVMLLCTRDGIVDSKTKSVASQLFSYALSYCRRAIRYKMKKGHNHILFFIFVHSPAASPILMFVLSPTLVHTHKHICDHNHSCMKTTLKETLFMMVRFFLHFTFHESGPVLFNILEWNFYIHRIEIGNKYEIDLKLRLTDRELKCQNNFLTWNFKRELRLNPIEWVR